MKKNIVIILYFFCHYVVQAQESLNGCAKLYLKSTDVIVENCDSTLKSVEIGFFLGGKVKVKYKTGEKKRIERNSLWGFRRNGEEPNRIFKKYHYTLIKIYPFVLYKTRRMFGHSYFFSSSLDSDIYMFTQKNIKKYLTSEQVQVIENNNTLRKKLGGSYNPFYILFSGIK